MVARLLVYLVFCLFAGLVPLPAAAEKPLVLPASGVVTDLKSVSLVRLDPEARLQPGELLRSDEGFEPFDAELNLRAPAAWIKLHVQAHEDSNGRYVLRVARRFFTRLDFYMEAADGTIGRRSATVTESLDAQTVGREFIFDLSLPPGQNRALLLHVQTFQGSLQPLEIALQDESGFAQTRASTYLIFGLIFGTLLALIFHNFILYLNLRQPGHLYYVLAMTSMLMLLGVDSGMLQNYLLPDFLQPWLARLNVLFAALLVITIFLFFRAFVEPARYSPRLVRYTGYGVVLLAVLALTQLFVGMPLFAWLAISIQVINTVVMVALLPASFIAGRRGSVEGYIFLAAWSIYVLSGFARTLLTLDFVGLNLVLEYMMYFAAVAEASILALGLSYRVRQLYERHATALHEQHKAALLANLDPLTGAYNRRFLENYLSNALNNRENSSFARSVLILDLDRFKQANDQYGHAAGDAILRDLVQRCRSQLDHDDILCRLGGDEFVVITSDQERDGLALAESILDSFRQRPFRFEGQTIPVTTSIGVVSGVSPKSTVSDILRMADQSLYQAKQAGRNQAILFDPDQATPFRHGPSVRATTELP